MSDDTTTNATQSANVAISTAITNHIPVIALDKDFVLRDIECYLDKPQRHRGIFAAETIEDLVSYYDQYKTADSKVFVNRADVNLVCIMNFGGSGTPCHKDHKAIWVPKKHQAYIELANKRFKQQELINVIEDYSNDISLLGSDREYGIAICAALHRLRTIKVSAMKNYQQETLRFSTARSAMEEVSVDTRDDMPHYIKLKAPAYLGCAAFSSVEVLFSLGIDCKDEEIYINTRLIGEEQIRL